MSQNFKCPFLEEAKERIHKTNLLLEINENRMRSLQNQIEGLSKTISKYCNFEMKPQRKNLKSIGLQVPYFEKIESKCPNTESASTSEKKEDRLPPLTNSLHDACALCADVVKAMVWSSDEEWTSNHQDSSLVKSRASSVQVSNPIFADNYSRSSSGADQDGTIRYDMNIPSESVAEIPVRRNVIVNASDVTRKEICSSIECCPASSIPKPPYNQSTDVSSSDCYVETTTNSSVCKESLNRKRRLPSTLKPVPPPILGSVPQLHEVRPSARKPTHKGKRLYLSSENSSTSRPQGQQFKQNIITLVNPKSSLVIPPSQEWIPSEDDNINLVIGSPLISSTQNSANKETNINQLVSKNPSTSKKLLLDSKLENKSEPLREGEIKSTSSPPRALTQLESSKSYESIQQQIPALVPINDNQKSLYKIPSNPFATAKTVSVTNLNHLKPVLRLKQVANDIFVTWDIPYLNAKQWKSINFYELYGKQESQMDTTGKEWLKLITMKSFRLPMECRLFNFKGDRYCFRIRTVFKDDEDCKLVVGPFSESCLILFN